MVPHLDQLGLSIVGVALLGLGLGIALTTLFFLFVPLSVWSVFARQRLDKTTQVNSQYDISNIEPEAYLFTFEKEGSLTFKTVSSDKNAENQYPSSWGPLGFTKVTRVGLHSIGPAEVVFIQGQNLSGSKEYLK